MTAPVATVAEVVRAILVWMEWAILGYFLFVNGFYLALLSSAGWDMWNHVRVIRWEDRRRVLASPLARISMISPAHNEAASIADSVRALLTLHYPNLEVVVVNDGSTDDTLEVLRREFDLVAIHPIYRHRIDTAPVRAILHSRTHPDLVVVDKENGGKADSLNAGLCIATGELSCSVDSDTLIEPEALQRVVRPYVTRTDVIAAGATIRVANGSAVRAGRVVEPRAPRRPVPGFQSVEYVRAFLFGRVGWNRLGGNLVISGAFGLFRREALVATGGYAHGVGEDMEIILRLRRWGYDNDGPRRVEFVPDPVAWTEAPDSLRILGRQRDRWHRGLTGSMRTYRGVFLRPRYGSLGFVAYPYFLLVEWLGPLVEVVGMFGLVAGLFLDAVNLPFAVLFFLVAYGLGTTLSLMSLAMGELTSRQYEGIRDRLWLLTWALLENVGYRQLTVFWRLRGLVNYLRGRRTWGVMERRGFTPSSR